MDWMDWMDGLDWILLRTLVQLEHLAVLKSYEGIYEENLWGWIMLQISCPTIKKTK